MKIVYPTFRENWFSFLSEFMQVELCIKENKWAVFKVSGTRFES